MARGRSMRQVMRKPKVKKPKKPEMKISPRKGLPTGYDTGSMYD